MTDTTLKCFKAYDIRGRIPDELNEDLAYKIGRAYATLLSPKKVCIGRDGMLVHVNMSGSITTAAAKTLKISLRCKAAKAAPRNCWTWS